MKKVLVSALALVALGGCATYYDYYKGGVQYTQDGDDCIYYAGEQGREFSREIRNMNGNKKIVYRNTRCEDLYNRDMAGVAAAPARQALVPAATSCNACAARSCNACVTPVVRRRYVIVPAM